MRETVYRGVVEEWRIPGQKSAGTVKVYMKPYDKPGPAKASVTIRRNNFGKRYVDGWVEIATVWERLDD